MALVGLRRVFGARSVAERYTPRRNDFIGPAQARPATSPPPTDAASILTRAPGMWPSPAAQAREQGREPLRTLRRAGVLMNRLSKQFRRGIFQHLCIRPLAERFTVAPRARGRTRDHVRIRRITERRTTRLRWADHRALSTAERSDGSAEPRALAC